MTPLPRGLFYGWVTFSRMGNRNDDTVATVFVARRAVFIDGKPTDVVGKERTGRFLRAAHQASAPTAETELASVS